ncbi:MAG: Nif11 family protein [Chloroflexi bacterium]|nr:Nif11 family protein [Chloroflexota bacterium]
MEKNLSGFIRQMRQDNAFRRKILASRANGSLAETLLAEGFSFSPEEMEVTLLPLVKTGVRAGRWWTDSSGYRITDES